MTNPQQVEKDKNVKPFVAPSADKNAPGTTQHKSGESKDTQPVTPGGFSSGRSSEGSALRTETPVKMNINDPEEIKAPLQADKKAV